MTTCYVYNIKTSNAVTVIYGEPDDIERFLDNSCLDTDYFGVTFSPAFGFNGGLRGINATARTIKVPAGYAPATHKLPYLAKRR